MGECINLRRTVEKKKLPVLDPNFPADMTFMARGGHVTLEVRIAEHGYPADYTYKWYWGNGNDFNAESSPYFNFTNIQGEGTHYIYCEVTNKAGTVRSRTATITVRPAYLYYYGNQYTENSGGWKLTRALPDGQGNGILGSVDFTANGNNMYLELHHVSNASTEGYLVTQNKIDLTGYSKIRFAIYQYQADSDYNWTMGATTADYSAAQCWVTAAHAPKNYNTWQTVDVDISGVSGSYYVGVWSWTYNHRAYAYIASVELIV